MWSTKSIPRDKTILLCSKSHNVVDIFKKLEKDRRRLHSASHPSMERGKS